MIACNRKRLVAVELGQDGEALFPCITLLKEQAEDLGRDWGERIPAQVSLDL